MITNHVHKIRKRVPLYIFQNLLSKLLFYSTFLYIFLLLQIIQWQKHKTRYSDGKLSIKIFPIKILKFLILSKFTNVKKITNVHNI